MKEFEYVVKDKIGLHARPAGLIVKQAGQFECDITLTNTDSGKSADAKKLFALMNLMIKQNCKINVRCSGNDENKAADAMKQCIEDCL